MSSTAVKNGAARTSRASLNKGTGVGRKRGKVDLKTYSGRMADRLTTLRTAKGLTVEEFATKVGVSRSTAFAYESNQRGIDPDLYPRMARVLGLASVSELFPAK